MMEGIVLFGVELPLWAIFLIVIIGVIIAWKFIKFALTVLLILIVIFVILMILDYLDVFSIIQNFLSGFI